MTVSPKRQAQFQAAYTRSRKAKSKGWLKRVLRLESLEKRQLMAADLPNFYNDMIPKDVNGDFVISPLDALVVINRLNLQGPGSLVGQAPTDRGSFVDVDGDNTLSPLDALAVINALNRGEGAGELVEVKYQFFSVNADGTVGAELPDSNTANSQPDAAISKGQKIIVRTSMTDLRRLNSSDPLRDGIPRGVFSAYHDLNYTNADGATTEKLEFQWGEYNRLAIRNTAVGGSFRLQYGANSGNQTAPINLVVTQGVQDSPLTAANIQAALEALPAIGVGNVRVLPGKDTDTEYRFDISFINGQARKNIPDATVTANNLTGNAPTITITTQDPPNPASVDVSGPGLNHDLGVPTNKYINGPDGVLKTTADPATYQISLMGGFSNSSTFLPQNVAIQFISVVDTLFVGGANGVVNLEGTISPLPGAGNTSGNNLGIALFGQSGNRAEYLTAQSVILPRGSITIAERLTAVNDALNVNEDATSTTLDVVANDIDLFGAAGSKGVSAVVQPATGGTVSFVNGGPNISFTPTPNFNGTTSFTYTVRNNLGDTAVGTVLVTVAAVNDVPVVTRTTPFTIAEDSVAPLIIAATDVFSPGPTNESAQTMTISSINVGPTATQGTATLVSGSVNFTPALNFFGNVVLQVTGRDDSGIANDPLRNRETVATITINVTPVNDAPVAFSGSLSVDEDLPLILIGTGAANDLLARSNAGPGETGAVALVSAQSPTAQGGTITTANGITTYQPAKDFFGQDTFTYRITDSVLTADGTITVTVNPVNDPAVAVNDTGTSARFVVPGIAAANPLDVMRNDNPGAANETRDFTVVSVTAASIGTVAIAPNGVGVIFTPPTGQFNVTSTFRYTIRDSLNRESSADVEVLIIPPILPFALVDTRSIPEGASATVIDVLSNDFANAGATKRLLSFTQPSVGVVTLNNNGTPTNLTDDTLSYLAPENFFGVATFTYTMIDSAVDTDNTIVNSVGTVAIEVTPVNDAPVAEARSANGTEDTVLVVLSNDITNGLSKGPGEDAQILTITDVVNQTPNSGTAAIDGGNIRFTPAPDFFGQVLIRYTVTDNGVTGTSPAPLSSSATLTINIAPANDPPVFNADSAIVTAESVARTFSIDSLLANDTPGPANEALAGQVVTFVPLTAPINTVNGGVVTQVGTNLVYTPALNYNGPDSFVYTITDSQSSLATSSATATIRVSEVNQAPTAETLARNVFASVPTNFDLTQALAAMPKGPANESGQTLRVTRVIPGVGTRGTVVLNANGTITYTAPLGASGRDTFTYEVTDNGTTDGVAAPLSSIGTFNIDVSPFIPSSVKGFVYIDDNRSGTMDSPELKMGGVEVTLTVAATATTPERSFTEKTLADGSYNFDLLPPGSYTVSYQTPILADDAPGPNSYMVNVVAPGDVNVVYSFGVLGIQARYANLLEYMSSAYDSASPQNRNAGIYAAIGANGVSEWTIARAGFSGDSYQEVVLSNDGTEAFVTAVRGANHEIYTATLTRRQFVQIADSATGAKIIRVMAKSEDLAWRQVSLAAPPVDIKTKSAGYLETVDDVFAEQNW